MTTSGATSFGLPIDELVTDAYRMVDAEGIQIHGGIGFTWEHDMDLYFKRAKGSEVTFGDATWNRELVAQVVLDDPESLAATQG